MRVIKETSIEGCKVTFYAWNNRYLIKLEQGLLEQTFKVSELDVSGETELLDLLDAEFVQQALKRFDEMGQSLHEARTRAEQRLP